MVVRLNDYENNPGFDLSGFSFVNNGYGYQKIENNNKVYLNQRNEGDVCVTRASFRWYIPGKFAGKNLEFKVVMDVDYNSDDDKEIRTESGITSGIGGNFPNPTLSYNLSQTPGKYTVTYAGVQAKDGDLIHWDNNGTSNSPGATGNKDYDVQNTSRDVKFTYHYKLHDYAYAERSAQITLKPFRYPDALTATDVANGNTEVSWSIPNATAGDDFSSSGTYEVQRSMDQNFNNPVSIGIVTIEKGKTDYSIEDKTGEENLNGTVYYRLRRSDAALWQWDYVKSGSIEKTMSHLQVLSAKAERHNWETTDAKKQQAKVTWTMDGDAEDQSKVWTGGAKVIVVQHKNQGGRSCYGRRNRSHGRGCKTWLPDR